jgi:hypothetical protein
MHSLRKQLLVLLLAVLVTAGMGLSVVQASTMNLMMVNMASEMSISGDDNCRDCGNLGDAKGTAACVAPTCVSPVASLAAPTESLDLTPGSDRHQHQDLTLFGAGSEPAPYPPRTSNIG